MLYVPNVLRQIPENDLEALYRSGIVDKRLLHHMMTLTSPIRKGLPVAQAIQD